MNKEVISRIHWFVFLDSCLIGHLVAGFYLVLPDSLSWFAACFFRAFSPISYVVMAYAVYVLPDKSFLNLVIMDMPVSPIEISNTTLDWYVLHTDT
jgi:hypothetical protein